MADLYMQLLYVAAFMLTIAYLSRMQMNKCHIGSNDLKWMQYTSG